MSEQSSRSDVTVSWVVVDDHGGDADADGLPAPELVVAADGGVVLARRLGLRVDVLVGDLDSAPSSLVDAVARTGAEVQRHPTDKDATDLELALAVAASRTSPDGQVVVLAGAGGRLDHALANVHALATSGLAHVRVRGRLGGADVHVVRGRRSLPVAVDATVTLLPSGGPAVGVSTEGLAYPLADETLPAWTTRGVSNVAVDTRVVVEVREGCLLVVVPGAADRAPSPADRPPTDRSTP